MQVTLEHLARRAADARKSLITMFAGPHGTDVGFELMHIDPATATPGEAAFAATVSESQADFLRRADVILADPDMCTLVDVAAPSMPDQTLREDDPISPHGFVLFAEPVPDRTPAGGAPIQALSWSYVPDGHPLLPRALMPDVTASVLVVTYSLSTDVVAAGRELVPNAPRYMPSSTSMWQIGSEIGQVYGGNVSFDDEGADPGFYQRLAAAFWTLSKQPLTTAEDAPAPTGKERRKYSHAGIDRPDQKVRIVRLRRNARPKSDESNPTDRRLSVRSAVRGHWKNAWRPSVQTHRLIYVAPYIRGPEDAPLIGGEKVFLAAGDKKPPRA